MHHENHEKLPGRLTAEDVDAARRELELPETATRSEVNRRYRGLARRWHPDVCDEEEEVCRERMRRLTRARRCLARLMANYRYSLRPEDIRRDQVTPSASHARRFEGSFPTRDSPQDAPVEELVRRAADTLGLGETATREEVRSAYRSRAMSTHPDRRSSSSEQGTEEDFRKVQAAYSVLEQLIRGYRYSFRPKDVRRDQESPLRDQQRRFGEDIWPDA